MEYANLTEKQSGALAAVLFQLLGASELLFKDLEAHFLRHNMELKQEQKKLASEFRRTATRMHYLYDRMSEVAVDCGRCESTDVLTGYLYDCNTVARNALYMFDAMYGQDEQASIKIESTLKLIAKNPVFGSVIADRYHLK